MPPPFPKDRQDHLLPGRSCLFFAKALTGKAARNGRAGAAPPGNKPECAASSHRSRLPPKRRPPSPSRAGTAAKRLLLATYPLSSALTMNRGGPAHGPPRFPVFADCPSPLSVKGKMPYTFSNLKRHNARKQFRCPATRCGFCRKRRFPAERAFAPDSAVRPGSAEPAATSLFPERSPLPHSGNPPPHSTWQGHRGPSAPHTSPSRTGLRDRQSSGPLLAA